MPGQDSTLLPCDSTRSALASSIRNSRAAPDQETTDLYVRIKASPTLIPRHAPPSQSTPFIGREPLLNEIKARIAAPDCRLLTLFGPGGSGKTRLAVEAARQTLADAQLGRFPDGAFCCACTAPVCSRPSYLPSPRRLICLSAHRQSPPATA